MVSALKQELKKAHKEVANAARNALGNKEHLDTVLKSLAAGAAAEDEPSKVENSTFIEGAMWLGKKAFAEGETIESKLHGLKAELAERKARGEAINSEEWLIQQTEQLFHAYNEGLQNAITNFKS
ncbi:MAG: hypothetical protein V2I33_24170 [Kangiellaceae bacterium]|jgi:hypothetical protein|nr:hypothetical protein [Kangiellaceae bacterium]